MIHNPLRHTYNSFAAVEIYEILAPSVSFSTSTMASKRKHNEGDNDSFGTDLKQTRTSVSDILNEYRGFSLQKDASEWEIPVEDGKIGDQEFFDKYVAKRQPCVINSLPKLLSGKFPSVSLEELKEVAGEKVRSMRFR
jgi:hypothetical protein